MSTYPMAWITAPGKIEFLEKRIPECGPQDVLVSVKAAAICGSDLHLYRGKHPSAPLPSATGHELAGGIAAVGKQVRRFKEGDRVTVEPVLACGECFFCHQGQYHLCQNISFQYRKGQGGFAPYFLAHQEHVFKLPDQVSFEEGALVEPLSVALHAIKNSGLRLGHNSAIFGAGAIGLLLLQLAGMVSGGKTFIVDIQDERLRLAGRLGATRTIHNLHEDALAVILAETGQMGVDRAFEAVGHERVLTKALQCLKKGGRATLLGIFESQPTSLPVNLFVQREITLAGSQGYNWDFPDAVELLAQKRIDVKSLITHRLPLECLAEGFRLLEDPSAGAVKVVVTLAA